MRKLKDDKKIKWTENYTEKTDYLKNMYEDIVGPNSYWRFEGKQIDGNGEWYVVISPAGVYGEHERKFFAGIRKLPDKWPAGGKKFDSLVDAFTYAHDTWGVPKPKSLPRYSGQDLVGIGRRIDDWKEEHEDVIEREVEKQDKESSSGKDIVKEAMGTRVHNKGGCAWHHSDFSDLDYIYRGDMEICEQIDIGYSRLLRLAVTGANRVLQGVDIPRSEFRPYDFPTFRMDDVAQEDNVALSQALRSEERIAHIYNHIMNLARNAPVPTEAVQNAAHRPSDFINVRRSTRRLRWHPRSRFMQGLYILLGGRGEYRNFEAERANDADYRRLLAGLVAYSERKENQRQFERISAGRNLPDSFSCCFRRSAIEKAIHDSSVTRERECAEYRGRYGLDADVPEEQIPINHFIEYSRTDGHVRMATVAPYRSGRDWNKTWSFSPELLQGDSYNQIITSLCGNDEERQNAVSAPLREALIREFSNPENSVNMERQDNVDPERDFRNRFRNVFGRILQNLGLQQLDFDPVRGAGTFAKKCEGRLISTMQTENGMGHVRVKSGHELSRFYSAIGKFYAGVKTVHSNTMGAGMFFQKLNNAEEVVLINSSNTGIEYQTLIRNIRNRYQGHQDILERMMAAANAVTVLDVDRRTGRTRRVPAADAGREVTPHDFYIACRNSGYSIYPGEIFDIFNNPEQRMRLIDRSAVEAMEVESTRERMTKFMDENNVDHLTVPQACHVIQTNERGEQIQVPSMSSDIALALDFIDNNSSSDFFNAINMSFHFQVQDDRSGIESAGLALDLFGHWQYINSVVSRIWDLRAISPDVYVRFMKGNMIPAEMPEEQRRQVMEHLDNYRFDDAKNAIEAYFTGIKQNSPNGYVMGGLSSLNFDSYINVKRQRWEREQRQAGLPTHERVLRRGREVDGNSLFVLNEEEQRIQNDPLNSITGRVQDITDIMDKMRTYVLGEIGKEAVGGRMGDVVTPEARAMMISGMRFVVPTDFENMEFLEESENSIQRRPGTGVNGSELVTDDNSVLDVQVIGEDNEPLGYISVGDLLLTQKYPSDIQRVYAKAASSVYSLERMSIKQNKGAASPTRLEDYSNEFEDGEPHLEEATRTDRHYNEFVNEVTMGLHNIFSIPHRIVNGEVRYDFTLAGSEEVTSRYLAERYINRLRNRILNIHEPFGRTRRISEELLQAIGRMHDFIDNGGAALDAVIREVTRRAARNDNPIWWRENGRVEYMADEEISIPSLLIDQNAIQQAAARGVPPSEQAAEATRIKEVAKKIIKRDAFHAMLQGRAEILMQPLDQQIRNQIINVVNLAPQIEGEARNVAVGIPEDIDMNEEEREALERAIDNEEDEIDRQIQEDIAVPEEEIAEEDLFEDEADAEREEAIQDGDVPPGPGAEIVGEEDGEPDAVIAPVAEPPVAEEPAPPAQEEPPVAEPDQQRPRPVVAPQPRRRPLPRVRPRNVPRRDAPRPARPQDQPDAGGGLMDDEEFNIQASSKVRGIMKESIVRMAKSSIRLAKEGKMDKALEIKKIIKRYIEEE